MPSTYNILVLCTGNSARSILGEAILNALGEGRIMAFSAGSQPVGKVNPFALQLLEKKGYDTAPYRSKSWDEFAREDSPPIDLVITVCDNAAEETCPIFPGAAHMVHLGFPDPAAVTGSDAEKLKVFEEVYAMIYPVMAFLVEHDPMEMAPVALRDSLVQFKQER